MGAMMKKGWALLVTGMLLTVSSRSEAAFHAWEIKEVYSNADGRVQFIELFTAIGSQTVLANHTITATSDGVTRTFQFPSNIVGNTANQHLLIATPGFASIPGAPVPDFILPCGPFFDPDATN